MQRYTSSYARYQLPDDKQAVLTDLPALIDQASKTFLLYMYGFTSRPLIDAINRAHSRGIECWLILDHTQSTGPTEVRMLHYLILQGFPVDHVIITTSPDHRQIMHEKVAIIDGRFVVEGSLNWSDSGFEQVNSLIVFDAPDLATTMTVDFETLKAWALAHEPQYQKVA